MPQGLLESKNVFCVESLEEINMEKFFYENTTLEKSCNSFLNQIFLEKINEILSKT